MKYAKKEKEYGECKDGYCCLSTKDMPDGRNADAMKSKENLKIIDNVHVIPMGKAFE